MSQITTEDIESALVDMCIAEREMLHQYIEDSAGSAPEIKGARTFKQYGVLTRDNGLVLKFEGGAEFDITITQRRASSNAR